eukprot:g1703.t1
MDEYDLGDLVKSASSLKDVEQSVITKHTAKSEVRAALRHCKQGSIPFGGGGTWLRSFRERFRRDALAQDTENFYVNNKNQDTVTGTNTRTVPNRKFTFSTGSVATLRARVERDILQRHQKNTTNNSTSMNMSSSLETKTARPLHCFEGTQGKVAWKNSMEYLEMKLQLLKVLDVANNQGHELEGDLPTDAGRKQRNKKKAFQRMKLHHYDNMNSRARQRFSNSGLPLSVPQKKQRQLHVHQRGPLQLSSSTTAVTTSRTQIPTTTSRTTFQTLNTTPRSQPLNITPRSQSTPLNEYAENTATSAVTTGVTKTQKQKPFKRLRRKMEKTKDKSKQVTTVTKTKESGRTQNRSSKHKKTGKNYMSDDEWNPEDSSSGEEEGDRFSNESDYDPHNDDTWGDASSQAKGMSQNLTMRSLSRYIACDAFPHKYKTRLENWKADRREHYEAYYRESKRIDSRGFTNSSSASSSTNTLSTSNTMINDHPPFMIPSVLWDTLYPYQRDGVRWLWKLRASGRGGILGDEMGVGKTVQVIAFLASLEATARYQSNYRASRMRTAGPNSTPLQPLQSSPSLRVRTRSAIIILPTTIIAQWVSELNRFAPSLRVVVLHETGFSIGNMGLTKKALLQTAFDATIQRHRSTGSAVHANTTNSSEGAALGTDVESGPSFVVVLTSYKTLQHRSIGGMCLNRRWDLVALDEGHIIRNPDANVTVFCKQFRTPHRLILTGVPLQNNLVELWSLFDFVIPGLLGTRAIFKAQFDDPIRIGGYRTASRMQSQMAFECARVLRETIAPFLLRRLKEDVLRKGDLNLPEKTETVLFCRLTSRQRKLYQSFLRTREVQQVLAKERRAFRAIMILRKICNHPVLCARNGVFQNQREKEVLLNFQLTQDNSNRDNSITNVYSGIANNQNINRMDLLTSLLDWRNSGKLLLLDKILPKWKKERHHVLLFTQTREMLDIVENYVVEKQYSYFRMDGTTPSVKRQGLVDAFNQPKSAPFLFLMTTRVGGLGLNLTQASRVVIIDPDWNPCTDVQARERAWRIGQTKAVTIFRLVMAGTIEEKIYHRQIFKHFLQKKILNDPNQGRFFDQGDLHDLFADPPATDSKMESMESPQSHPSHLDSSESHQGRERMTLEKHDHQNSETSVSSTSSSTSLSVLSKSNLPMTETDILFSEMTHTERQRARAKRRAEERRKEKELERNTQKDKGKGKNRKKAAATGSSGGKNGTSLNVLKALWDGAGLYSAFSHDSIEGRKGSYQSIEEKNNYGVTEQEARRTLERSQRLQREKWRHILDDEEEVEEGESDYHDGYGETNGALRSSSYISDTTIERRKNVHTSSSSILARFTQASSNDESLVVPSGITEGNGTTQHDGYNMAIDETTSTTNDTNNSAGSSNGSTQSTTTVRPIGLGFARKKRHWE